MKNIYKTIIFTITISIITISSAFYIQSIGKSSVSTGCSYLDPITIDILAFLVSIFLVVEGLFRISVNSKAQFKRQITRSLRVAIGLAIITIHLMQFLYK